MFTLQSHLLPITPNPVKDRLVVIPTYNEIENIEAIIRKVFSLPVPFDLLIVDDGSGRQVQFRYPNLEPIRVE